MDEITTSTETVAARLILDGSWEAASIAAATDSLVMALAKREGLVAPAELLQSAVNQFLGEHGLGEKASRDAWLDSFGLSIDQLNQFCEAQLLRSALLASFAHADLLNWFDAHRELYSAAQVSIQSFHHESDAWLIRNQQDITILENLFWQRQQADPALGVGTQSCWSFLKQFPDSVRDLVAEVDVGQCTPPVLINGYFRVYLITQKREAEFNAAVESEIRNDLLMNRLTQLNADEA